LDLSFLGSVLCILCLRRRYHLFSRVNAVI